MNMKTDENLTVINHEKTAELYRYLETNWAKLKIISCIGMLCHL